MQPLLYESHMHTPLCKHAQGEPEEYAAAAAQRGLAGIIVTCHNPPIDGWSPHVRMAEAEFDAYVALVARARAAWVGRVDVRLGPECDFVPGMEDALAAQLARAEFHHVLGSVHPQIAAYRDRYFTGDALAFQRTYFEHLALAAETGLFDTLAHPDLVKNEFPQEWQPAALADTLAATLDRIAATGVAMELNTSGLQKRLPEMNPGPGILAQMAQRGIPVVLGADAHTPTRVAADYATGLDLLEAAGYTHVSLFLDRRRREISVADARQSLRVSQPA